jgi:hypothetical protein
MTLHQAIIDVIKKNGGQPMDIRVIASQINSRGLYSKKNGTPVSAWNVGARANADVDSGSKYFRVYVGL